MRFTRRRSDRPAPARLALGSSLETLERRELLSGLHGNPFSIYIPSDLPVRDPITHAPISLSAEHLVEPGNPNSPLLNNAGKVVSGRDRDGDVWAITVHGPGIVIVTDTTPGDGVLDDTITTI